MPKDVDWFVSRNDFELVKTESPAPPPPTKLEAPSATPSEPEEKSLAGVKGIGPASARKLEEVGITTPAEITEQTPEELADILGFSVERTRNIIQNASEQS